MRALLAYASLLLLAAPLPAQGPKRPLDHDVYDSWNSIDDEVLSNPGGWIAYALTPQDGDAVLHVRAVQGSAAFEVPRGRAPVFAQDEAFAAFTIKPLLSEVRKARRAKKKPDQLPKDSLGIMVLATGEVAKVAAVKSFKVPKDGGGWVAYLMEKEEGAQPDSAAAAEKPDSQVPKKRKKKEEGTTLVLRNVESGRETRYEHVTAYAFDDAGTRLAYVVSAKSGEGDGVFVVTLPDPTPVTVLAGPGVYKTLTFDAAGRQLAFLTNRDDYAADQPAFSLYTWQSEAPARVVATAGSEGLPAGWWVSEHGDLTFSDSGRRLYFGSAPRPEPDADQETPEWEAVKLDVWNWRDPLLQPMQLVRRERDLERSYRAVAWLREGRVVQLADTAVPALEEIARKGDADLALANSNVPYRQDISWDMPEYNDVYVVDVRTGARRKLLERLHGEARLSPGGKYVTWWDGSQAAWFAEAVSGGAPVNLTAGLPHPVDDQLFDMPMVPRPYGSAGWTEDDGAFLVYDQFDVWALDPTGRRAPRSVTEGVGRRDHLEFRYVRLDREREAIAPDQPILLRVFDDRTKAAGFARDRVNGTREPQTLVMDDRRFGFPRKADDGDIVMFTRERFDEFPDLWVSGLDFAAPHKVSDANPQMHEYLWGTAELTEWRTTNGRTVRGILYKPEDFDASKKYPMMVYFYEKMSDQLNVFRSVGPGSSSISVPFYVSRGYVVFIPDIYYRDGYPGESALDCIVPGVLSVVDQGFVDPKRIGVQGHSWGGYQTAFMVTRTDIFAAAEAGAPVANMTSAYGGIRWGSGMSRMFQYERSQSRIGASLWKARSKYIENSPLFWADRIATPVLMMHNDDDSAVPWYQGIEFFTALRRLHKPAWLVVYNGEPHGLRKYQNKKDWAIRMQQFFDHYLKDAPAPVWLAEGIPAVEKGKTLGLELEETPATVTTGGGGHDQR